MMVQHIVWTIPENDKFLHADVHASFYYCSVKTEFVVQTLLVKNLETHIIFNSLEISIVFTLVVSALIIQSGVTVGDLDVWFNFLGMRFELITYFLY